MNRVKSVSNSRTYNVFAASLHLGAKCLIHERIRGRSGLHLGAKSVFNFVANWLKFITKMTTKLLPFGLSALQTMANTPNSSKDLTEDLYEKTKII